MTLKKSSNNIRMAKLTDGQIVEYDMIITASDKFVPNREKFVYLGEGVIYKINGVKHSGKDVTGRFYRCKRLGDESTK